MWINKSFKNLRALLVILVCIIIIICITKHFFSCPSVELNDLKEYLRKNENTLIEIADKFPDQYIHLQGYLGLESVDTRQNYVRYDFTCFSGGEFGQEIYYAKSGILEKEGYAFSEDAYIEGLGVGGKGYIKCVLIKDKWFFVEHYIPT